MIIEVKTCHKNMMELTYFEFQNCNKKNRVNKFLCQKRYFGETTEDMHHVNILNILRFASFLWHKINIYIYKFNR